jgi:hypothetical protein
MKKRIEKVEDLFRKKQAYETSIKKKIKSMNQEDRKKALDDFNSTIGTFMDNYRIIKGNYMRDLDYLNELDNNILLKYKEFNTYKLNVLYDLEMMNQEMYDSFDKDIAELKSHREKIIIKNKKSIIEQNDKIDKINKEISERFIDMVDSNKEEKKLYYSEIIERKKLIFDITKPYIDNVPILDDDNILLSTLIYDYNPIHKYEINLNSLDLKMGTKVSLENNFEELEN